MIDWVTPLERSKIMAAVRGKNTAPELYVRKQLFAAGFRFRLHVACLPGKPDIVLPRFKIAIFVHGCFWHGHSCVRGKRPATNKAFWSAKIDGNMRRDRRDRAALKAAGWRAIVIWQCGLQSTSAKLVKLLEGERLAGAKRGRSLSR